MGLGIDSGFDTARVAAVSAREQAARVARDARALACLQRRDADDIAVILGLLPAPAPPCQRKGTRT